MAAGRLKALLRLYPRSWRNRYGREMEVLLEELPRELGVGLDLVLGAAGAYASVVRGSRFLSACGAFLHGVTVAVLLQAIAFVTFVLVAERSPSPFMVQAGPLQIITYLRPSFFELRAEAAALAMQLDWLPASIVLAALLGVLAFLVAAPRLVKTPE